MITGILTFAYPGPANLEHNSGLNAFMDCSGAALCGVISMENGLGSGNYKHDTPSVHGLVKRTAHPPMFHPPTLPYLSPIIHP